MIILSRPQVIFQSRVFISTQDIWLLMGREFPIDEQYGVIILLLCRSLSMRTTQPEIACLKLTIETLEQGVKYVQS